MIFFKIVFWMSDKGGDKDFPAIKNSSEKKVGMREVYRFMKINTIPNRKQH